MSHYRNLIEKLSARHVERDDFEELVSICNETLQEVEPNEKEELQQHATVILAAALSKSKGNVKQALESLKTVERQMTGSVFVPSGSHTSPVKSQAAQTSISWAWNKHAVYCIFYFLFLLFLVFFFVLRK